MKPVRFGTKTKHNPYFTSKMSKVALECVFNQQMHYHEHTEHIPVDFGLFTADPYPDSRSTAVDRAHNTSEQPTRLLVSRYGRTVLFEDPKDQSTSSGVATPDTSDNLEPPIEEVSEDDNVQEIPVSERPTDAQIAKSVTETNSSGKIQIHIENAIAWTFDEAGSGDEVYSSDSESDDDTGDFTVCTVETKDEATGVVTLTNAIETTGPPEVLDEWLDKQKKTWRKSRPGIFFHFIDQLDELKAKWRELRPVKTVCAVDANVTTTGLTSKKTATDYYFWMPTPSGGLEFKSFKQLVRYITNDKSKNEKPIPKTLSEFTAQAPLVEPSVTQLKFMEANSLTDLGIKIHRRHRGVKDIAPTIPSAVKTEVPCTKKRKIMHEAEVVEGIVPNISNICNVFAIKKAKVMWRDQLQGRLEKQELQAILALPQQEGFAPCFPVAHPFELGPAYHIHKPECAGQN